jgi:hypothetical protein
MTRPHIRWLLAVTLVFVCASWAKAQDQLVQIYLVRHTETEETPSDLDAIHLSDVGCERASLLTPALAGVGITHLIASHTLRTRETLEPLAQDRSLPIVQLPSPDRPWKGRPVTDQLSRREAVDPIADAILALAPGSTVVVGLNGDNLFAVLHRLGVPVAETGDACEPGALCVPCLDNTCFPHAYDRLWYLALRPGRPEPVVFLELRYGTGWKPSER